YFVPLIVSAGFFAAFFAFGYFRRKPLIISDADVRPVLTHTLHFLGWMALIIFIVRVVDAFIFDVLMSRRRNVVAPQLLRPIVAIVIYLLLGASAIKILFDYDVKTALTGGAVVAAVIGLALQDTLGNLFSGIALHMEGAFDVGDVLHSGEYVGVVESVSWRATRMRAFN